MSWKAEYAILILISTVVDYYAGIFIYRTADKLKRKYFLAVSLLVNLGLLFTFKYFNFLSESLRAVLSTFSFQMSPVALQVLLPVGISFYTFQTLSYTIDVYKGKIVPEDHFGRFAVFVSFFPQLVAGPIERAKNLIPQFTVKHVFNYEQFVSGFELMIRGFFKKIVIADRLALFVNLVYNNPTNYDGTFFIVATIFFAIQIYCDFSGYTDIARGAARMLGFELMLNFKRPYFARNLSDFWRRWHISLSSWFRDYLYIPLGGSRLRISRVYLNILIVFVLSGLWHGANWTFLLWGLVHGVMLIVLQWSASFRLRFSALVFGDSLRAVRSFFSVVFTFIIVNVSWVFFRANSVHDAFLIFGKIFRFETLTSFTSSFSSLLTQWNAPGLELGLGAYQLSIALVSILGLYVYQALQEYVPHYLKPKSWQINVMYLVLLLIVFYFGTFRQYEFIYFQF